MPQHDRPSNFELSHLPADFEFGATSAAFGVEGAADLDGRQPSIWDAVSAAPGRTVDGSTGAEAVDHYHRYSEDVALLARLGVDAYRFSISWSRVQPGGRGDVSRPGLDFYDRLVDELLAAGIEPWVTIYHWDLPLATMLAGGWLERDTAGALGDLAALVGRRLGDRVHRWTTMADPVVHMAYGHALGVDAPGLTLLADTFAITHHLLLGHARAREALSAERSATIGMANRHTSVGPVRQSPADHVAAAIFDSYHNRQFADPLFLGRYPRLLQPLIDRSPGLIADGDLDAISAPLDFYGVSYFHPTTVAAAPDNVTIPFAVVEDSDAVVTDSGWPVAAESLTALLLDLTRRYPRLPPVVITENGAAYSDVACPDSTDSGAAFVPDQRRIDFLRAHLSAIDDAVAAGVDVRGYFHRGLTDAWEGSDGFSHQFGLVRVEPGTLDRSPRESFEFFRAVIAQHRRAHT